MLINLFLCWNEFVRILIYSYLLHEKYLHHNDIILGNIKHSKVLANTIVNVIIGADGRL